MNKHNCKLFGKISMLLVAVLVMLSITQPVCKVNAADEAVGMSDEKAITLTAKKKDQTLTVGDFSVMMSKVIKKSDRSLLPKWKKLAKKALRSKKPLRRNDAKLILYEAACILGLGKLGTQYWCDFQQAFDELDIINSYTIDDSLFGNTQDTAPFEVFINGGSGYDYITSALIFSNGYASLDSEESFFKRLSKTGDDENIITKSEGRAAADRLYAAYCNFNEGCIDIDDYETDWSDPALKDAKKLKKSILNTTSNILKSDVFIQGKTYTGTAYYVSNSGNDSNTGKSPEQAWETLERVSEEKLEFGDAVFFERGGSWYGRLWMREGVTYSAYGEGTKPVWSGSPLNAADSDNWEYYTKTSDGGKIWRFKKKQYSCGLVLLDGHIVARNAYPFWDGEKYCTPDGKQKFDISKELKSDLMFCSLVELEGMSMPCEVWNSGRDGYIYLRCDKGNPGDVFSQIELAVGVDLITTAEGGYNTIDNICYRCFTGGGLDANCHDHIIFQNCESCWNGGGVKFYQYENGRPVTLISAGGMLLFGSHLIGRNNYIHDCENKGIAVVINGSGHASLERKDIVAEGNIVERCGKSIYMMTEFVPEGVDTVMEDIIFRNNFIINSGKGWRCHNEMWLGNGCSTYGSECEAITLSTIKKTGLVLFENNLIYKPRGACLMCNAKEKSKERDYVAFKNNSFILEPKSILFLDSMESSDGVITEHRGLFLGKEKDSKLNKALQSLSSY